MNEIYKREKVEFRLSREFRAELAAAGADPHFVMERFLDKIRPCDDGCWRWSGYLDKDGYGTFNVFRTWREKAHRFALMTESSGLGGLSVLHSKDTPSCVRPSHLRLGTQRENIRDMDSRGRRGRGYRRPNSSGELHWSKLSPEKVKRGEKSARAKLSLKSVTEIRSLILAGESQRSIAKSYDICHSTVGAIASGRNWAHLGRLPAITAQKQHQPRAPARSKTTASGSREKKEQIGLDLAPSIGKNADKEEEAV